jgi:hypothetical protein
MSSPILWGPPNASGVSVANNLESGLQFANGTGGAVYAPASPVNPSVTATFGNIGDLYIGGIHGLFEKITTSGTDTNWQPISPTGATSPAAQALTASSGTYTPSSSSVAYIRVTLQAPGGGGYPSGSIATTPTSGGSSSFGSLFSATGGGAATSGGGGAGGSPTTSSSAGLYILQAGSGGGGNNGIALATLTTASYAGGSGGSALYGGAGTTGAGSATSAQAYSGAGGGGAGSGGTSGNVSGSGGGAGGYVIALITGPALAAIVSSGISYTNGSAGNAGTGTSSGGAGGTGQIFVEEFYPSVGASSSGVTTVGTIDSQTPSSHALVISGSDIYAQSASTSNPGMVNNTTQSFSGNKTFSASSTTALEVGPSSQFIFDTTNDALGIGIQPSISVAIDIVNTSGSSKAIQETGYGTGSTPVFRGRFARGTSGSPAAAQSGDDLAVISGRGYGTSQFAAASTGIINVVAGETFTNTSNATYLQFETTPTGSVTASEAMRVNSTGNVLIGTTTDSGTQKLQVNGNSNVGTVTTGVWNGTATAGQSFLTSGTTYTTPAGITTATLFKFTLVGGGGGGGGGSAARGYSCAGGSGGYGVVWLTGLSPSTGYTIAIGSAGSAGTTTPSNGGNGGNTTLTVGATTYTASGGTGGTLGPVTNSTNGAAGGSTTNLTLAVTGQNGGSAAASVANSAGPSGGSNPMGSGGSSVSDGASGTAAGSQNGLSGTGYGAGGGGGSSSNTSAAAWSGGAGTQGAILVEWKN